MKRFFKFIGWVVLAILLIVTGFMTFSTLLKYKPEKVTILEIHKQVLKNNTDTGDEFNIMTWNIGYAGLGLTDL